MLTGFHGFHVMMGGFMLAVMLSRSVFYNHFDPHSHFGFEAASWYWHCRCGLGDAISFCLYTLN